jgi:putative flippase GtrA
MFSTKLASHSAVRYLFIGASAFATDYLFLLFLYQALGVNLFFSTSAGFLAGFLISFISNRQWAFGGAHSKRVTRQVVEYLLLAGFNYLFTVYAVALLNSYGVKPFVGKILVMGVIVAWNYVIFRWVIFKHQKLDIT